jgi:hypothetical protein
MKITKTQLLQFINEELQINQSALTVNALPVMHTGVNNSLVNEIVLREYIRETLHHDYLLNEGLLSKGLTGLKWIGGVGGVTFLMFGGCIDELFGINFVEDLWQDLVMNAAGELAFIGGLMKGGAKGAALTAAGAAIIITWNLKPELFHGRLSWFGLQPNHTQRSIWLILSTLAIPVVIEGAARRAFGAVVKSIYDKPGEAWTRMIVRPDEVPDITAAARRETIEALDANPTSGNDITDFVETVEGAVDDIVTTSSFDDLVADLGVEPYNPEVMSWEEIVAMDADDLNAMNSTRDEWEAAMAELKARRDAGEFEYPTSSTDEVIPNSEIDEIPADFDERNVESPEEIAAELEALAFIGFKKQHAGLMKKLHRFFARAKFNASNSWRLWSSWVNSADVATLSAALKGVGSHRGFTLTPHSVVEEGGERWLKIHAKRASTTDGIGNDFFADGGVASRAPSTTPGGDAQLGAVEIPYSFTANVIDSELTLIPNTNAMLGLVREIAGDPGAFEILIPFRNAFDGATGLNALTPGERTRAMVLAMSSAGIRESPRFMDQIDHILGKTADMSGDDETDLSSLPPVSPEEIASVEEMVDMVEAAYNDSLEQWDCHDFGIIQSQTAGGNEQ